MFYTNAQLDRADHLRKDDAGLKALFQSDAAQLLPVWRGKVLVGELVDDLNSKKSQDNESMAGITGSASVSANSVSQNSVGKKYVKTPAMLSIPVSECPPSSETDIFLGLLDEVPVFARSLSELDETDLQNWIALGQSAEPEASLVRFEDLRVIGPLLKANDGALMAYARGLMFWHDTCRFCSRCGNALNSIHGGHIKCCNNDNCNYQTFPRTDPAVIMLVTRDATDSSPPLCLLGRNAAWPSGVYSTLAGFVETGESLEHAVQREVFEEANIKTKDVRYIASQPWPFPRSIMLGFEATATSTEITVDPNELDAAQWFSVEELKTFGNWGDGQYEYQLPRTDSIARFLIDRWIAEHQDAAK